MTNNLLSAETVAAHNTRESCWIIVHGNVYDVTDFLDDHPGGSNIILKYAGKDATEEYDPIHPPNAIMDNLPKEKHLGKVEPGTIVKMAKELTQEEIDREERVKNRPPLSEILNLHDFEAIAKEIMPPKAWAYYSSAADDEITNRENHLAYQRIWFRPRVLRDVTHVDWSTKILGHKTSMPIYITATALGKLGHPEGEVLLTRAAAKHGIIQMIPTLASCSFDDIVNAAQPGQVQFMQLYVNKDRDITKRLVQHAEKRGIKGLFITVDAPQLGRREKDMRMKFEGDADVQVGTAVDRSQGAARAISSFIDPVPIILKGIQCWEDALMALEAKCDGIVLSNHGGRQLDMSRSGIEVLEEVVTKFKERGLWPCPKFEIYIDGGVRRATDVLKAVAMGATAVGIGRPFLYAYSAYGQDGINQALQILKESFDEMEMNMRLLGARTIEEVVPEMVDTRSLCSHSSPPANELYQSNYDKLRRAAIKSKL
ncbi:probable CYB2-L-lactate dehydrogenase (cytochrome b2) [Serendipita indica DSM 11827]|uniref:L-lactate dehydrogenase (cytochrome) n=1 Tax=Serendipita indica (strain DSM 11827) TaxID=1109443 RepID=G4TLT2_SERID|nr:probable CYB2-L-lactate dehydrogenase (cytochrome b2) [Serendipita indica DSM 11827]